MVSSGPQKETAFLVCTWNLGDKPGKRPTPSSTDLAWLSTQVSESVAEIVVIGLQEFHPDRVADWKHAFLEALPSGFAPMLTDPKDNALDTTLPLMIFARNGAATAYPVNGQFSEVLKYAVSDHEHASKGGVAITLQCKCGLVVRVVNTHLKESHACFEKRNEQQQKLQKRFGSTSSLPTELAAQPTVLLQLGDFNYRIVADCEVKEPVKNEPNGDAAFEAVFAQLIEICEAGQGAAKLWPAHDQLQKALSAGLAFEEYEEAPVNFSPTYARMAVPPKDGGCPVVDLPVYDKKKKRLPGWCDRVLWKHVVPGATVRSALYDAIEAVKWTDHRPVVAVLHMSAGSKGLSDSGTEQNGKLAAIKAKLRKHSSSASVDQERIVELLKGFGLTAGQCAKLLQSFGVSKDEDINMHQFIDFIFSPSGQAAKTRLA